MPPLKLKEVDLYFCGECGRVLRGYAEDTEYFRLSNMHCKCGVSNWRGMSELESWKRRRNMPLRKLNVVGIIPTNAEWRKMKKVWDACKDARVDPPEEVIDFFGGEHPDVTEGSCIAIPYQVYNKYGREGVEISKEDIPTLVRTIRIYSTY